MRAWWQRRTLKLRLTLWFAAATLAVVGLFAGIVYEVVEHRLAAEIDRQLRIDFDLVEAQLDADRDGNVRWLLKGAHGDEGFARLSAWFEVWSEEKTLLLRHWPVPESEIKTPVAAPLGSVLQFSTVELEPGLHVRLMERPARLRERGVVLRLFRDESEIRRTLREIFEVFFLVAPLAGAVAALGGYWLASRSLAPIEAIAERAKRITSESLGQRLPVQNPHDEVGQLAGVFNATLQRLENSFEELKRFTADASHELRTPLTALRATGEVALREADHPAISSMLEEAERLEGLIESLLTLARMENESAEQHCGPVEVMTLLAEVRETLGVLAQEKQQTVSLSGDATLYARADPQLLWLAVTNVLHNAVRYALPNTVVAVEVRDERDAVVISVQDEGPGIAPQHQMKIFERFYRVDPARSRAAGGYGLGLAIARRSLERMGGSIELDSAIGRGSVFSLRLPRA